MATKIPTHKTQGIALISVLFIATAVLLLSSILVFTMVRDQQANRAARTMNDALQLADAVSERGRLEVVEAFKTSFSQSRNFVREVSAIVYNESTLSTNSTLKAAIEASGITTSNGVVVAGQAGRWQVTGATRFDPGTQQPTGSVLFLEVSATAETSSGVQTVIRRIDMGHSSIFDLAMLSRRTDCIYCHLRVNGDVGSLGAYLQPGGNTNPNKPDGGIRGGSIISGRAFLQGWAGARDPNDPSIQLDSDTDLEKNPNVINGAVFQGGIYQKYTGDPLPQKDGANAFPVIDKTVAKDNAKGSLSGGMVYTLAIGDALGTVPTQGNTPVVSGSAEKNAILVGTASDPLVLEGDVYFEGDVVIKGVVKGRGAIYAGRNIYVAGNVTYSDPPETCAQKTNPDSCAQTALQANKDELRLAARGSIVLGDYTEYGESGDTKLWQGLQASRYFRQQFGFDNKNDKKCFEKSTGEELEVVAVTDSTTTTYSYRNLEGEEVISSDQSAKNIKNNSLVCVSEQSKVNKDAYSYSFRPGNLSSQGNFTSWLSDGQYQSLLGQEKRSFDSWRYPVAKMNETGEELENELNKQFTDLNLSDSSIKAMAKAIEKNLPPDQGERLDLIDADGKIVGRVMINNYLWVTVDPPRSYDVQTTKVDAFLYANRRIAGKTFGTPLVINGGMIGQDIGVLAPGVTDFAYFNNVERYNFLGDWKDPEAARPDCTSLDYVRNFLPAASDAELASSPWYQPEADDCALTINYDYRLRNGGLGFNLVEPEIGRTLSWHVADRQEQQVKQPEVGIK
jgi:hypothetical protein